MIKGQTAVYLKSRLETVGIIMQSWPGQTADCWKANWKRVLVLFIIEMVNLEEARGRSQTTLTFCQLFAGWHCFGEGNPLLLICIPLTFPVPPTYLVLSTSFVNDPEGKGAPCGTTKLHTATYSSITGPASWPQRPPLTHGRFSLSTRCWRGNDK